MTRKYVAVFGLGYDQLEGIKELRKNFKILGFDENEKSKAIKYVDKYFSINFKKKSEILKICRNFNVRYIFSFNTEGPLPIVGYLNTKLNLQGIKQQTVNLVTNKYNLRKKFKKNGIVVPDFKVFKKKDTDNFINKISFPKIFKPIIGSASRGVFIAIDKKSFIKNFKQQKKYYNNLILAENFVIGDIYAIDGWFSNRFIFAALTKKFRDSRFPLLDKSLIFNYSDNLLKKKAILLANKCCKAVKVKNVPIHLEFIVSKKKVIPIDFSIRGAGSQLYSKCISELIKYSSSKVQIDLQIKKIPIIKTKSKFFFYVYFITSMKNSVMKKINLKKLKEKKYKFDFLQVKKEGEKIYRVNNGLDRLGIIYLKFRNLRIFLREKPLLDKILKKFDIE